MQKRGLSFTSIFFIFLSVCHDHLFALPQDPLVIEGKVHLEPQENELSITAGDRSIIHWKDFSINSNEKVSFTLPSSEAAVLNRVVGELPSTLLGQLQSNGLVYLINPQGILIGKEGVIQVGGFLASTLDVPNDHFLAGEQLVFQGDSWATIENRGTVIAENGNVVFLASQIHNIKNVSAPNGTIVFGVGQEITYFPYGDEKIQICLKPQIKNGEESIGILQQGTLLSPHVELKADGNFYSYAIKNEGVIEAVSAERRDGFIVLIAEDGVASHSGILKAPEVRVLGQHVRLVDDAVIDASSASQGGTILIGGDYQGSNPQILNANTTVVEKNVVLTADALEKGDGGKIIVWADGATGCYGTMNVNAGPLGGNGGLVEASGKSYLDFTGFANAEALLGTRGTLLLDPSNTTISTGADANVTFTACPTGTYAVTANNAVINNATLASRLQLGTCNISISTAAAGTQAGTITVSNDVIWTSSNSLTMNANSGTTINAHISNTSNSGSITINSGTTATSTLTVSATGAISLIGSGVAPTGTLTLNSSAIATSDIAINGPLTVTDKFLTISVADDFTLGAAPGAINFNSPGKTFAFTSTAGTGSAALLNGAVIITDGSSLWTSAGSVTINDGLSTAGTGTMTINSVGSVSTGASSVLTYNSTGDLAITISGAGNDISLNGTTTITAANATFTPVDDFTLGGPMAFSAVGKTLSFNAGISTTQNFNNALTVTGGNLSIQAFDDLVINATPGAITYNVPGGTCNFISTGGADPDFNINGTLAITNGTLTATTFDDIIVGGTGSFIYNSSATATLTANGPDGDITINGTLDVTNGNINMNSTSIISGGAGSIITWSSPGTWTMISTGMNIVFNGSTTISNGTVSMTTPEDMTIGGTFTWSSSGALTMMNTTPAVGSATAINGMVNFTNGSWSIDSQGSISTGGASTLNYSAPSAFTMLSHLGAITFSGPVSLNTAAAFSATASAGSINVNNLVRNTSSGAMTIAAGASINIGDTELTIPAQIGSAGGLTQFTAGDTMTIQSSETIAGATATVGFSSGGQTADISMDVENSFRILSHNNQNAGISSTRNVTLAVGQDVLIRTSLVSGNTGQAFISAAGNLLVTANNISLLSAQGGALAHVQTSQGKLQMVANNNISLSDSSLIANTGSGNLILVVDQQAPFSPSVGPGQFNLFSSANITTGGGDLSIFTATPSQNQVQGQMNGATLAEGNVFYGVYFSTSNIADPPPFTIFYKAPVVGNRFYELGLASSELTQQQLNRAMGWAWMSPFVICYDSSIDPEKSLSRREMLFKRKPFEYPILFPVIECPSLDIPSVAYDPFRYLSGDISLDPTY